MTDRINESDLHAYVDGLLSAADRQAVAHFLTQNPADASRIAVYAAQRAALRDALAEHATEPSRRDLDIARLIEARRNWRGWRVAASIVLALGLGGAGGWLARTPRTPDRPALALSLLEQQAMASHVVFTGDRRHPIELDATQSEHLAQWLSARLDRRIAPPNLDPIGFHLIGGRLLATERGGAAALFVYENDGGDRLSLVLRPMTPDLHVAQAEMARGAVNLAAWIAHGLGYAVVAALPDRELDVVSDRVRHEMVPPG